MAIGMSIVVDRFLDELSRALHCDARVINLLSEVGITTVQASCRSCGRIVVSNISDHELEMRNEFYSIIEAIGKTFNDNHDSFCQQKIMPNLNGLNERGSRSAQGFAQMQYQAQHNMQQAMQAYQAYGSGNNPVAGSGGLPLSQSLADMEIRVRELEKERVALRDLLSSLGKQYASLVKEVAAMRVSRVLASTPADDIFQQMSDVFPS